MFHRKIDGFNMEKIKPRHSERSSHTWKILPFRPSISCICAQASTPALGHRERFCLQKKLALNQLLKCAQPKATVLPPKILERCLKRNEYFRLRLLVASSLCSSNNRPEQCGIISLNYWRAHIGLIT
jgi:hypothetical protein